MITINQAKKYCNKLKCGYCLYHDKFPFTCCNYLMNIFTKENGFDWCKKNIKYYQDFIPLSDLELNNFFNIKKINKNDLYDFTLLDLL